MRFVKVQQKNFLENVISDADYKFLKNRLKRDDYTSWYFVVWFLTATGARVTLRGVSVAQRAKSRIGLYLPQPFR